MTVSRETPVRLCGCGCGEAVARRYRPGHDQRHKGILARAALERNADGTMSRVAIDAVQTALDLGWGRYIDEDTLHISPILCGNIKRALVSDVQVFLVEASGECHSNHSCPRLTQSARRAGQVNPITRRAYYSFVDRRPATEYQPQGFDACPTCLRDWTALEWVATTEIGRIVYQEAISPSDPPRPSSIPFQIEPDPLPIPTWAPPTGPAIPLPNPTLAA